jgi:hypothetical protein
MARSTDGAVTRWYPTPIAPVRIGVYEIDVGIPRSIMKYSYWDGARWGFREPTVENAYLYRAEKAAGPIVKWRGLARKP